MLYNICSPAKPKPQGLLHLQVKNLILKHQKIHYTPKYNLPVSPCTNVCTVNTWEYTRLLLQI